MHLKLFVLIIVLLDFSQDGVSFKLPANSKLDNGENLLGSILKSSSPLNRFDLKAKCNACKLQNKCKLQEPCDSCDEICSRYQQSLPQTDKINIYSKLRKPSDLVGISLRASENPELSENDDRYYTVGAFKGGPVQQLLQKLLNLNIKGQTDHIVVMVKPKSKQPRPLNHPVIIDTAHVFTPNEGEAKIFEMELHKVGKVQENTEELVEKLDQKFEDVVDQKRKTNQDPHLKPQEIDEIIEKTIEEVKRPKLTSRVMENPSDEIPRIGSKRPNTNPTNEHRVKTNEDALTLTESPVSQHQQHLNQGHKNQIVQSINENVASAPIVQPPSTYEDVESSTKIPLGMISQSAMDVNEENDSQAIPHLDISQEEMNQHFEEPLSLPLQANNDAFSIIKDENEANVEHEINLNENSGILTDTLNLPQDKGLEELQLISSKDGGEQNVEFQPITTQEEIEHNTNTSEMINDNETTNRKIFTNNLQLSENKNLTELQVQNESQEKTSMGINDASLVNENETENIKPISVGEVLMKSSEMLQDSNNAKMSGSQDVENPSPKQHNLLGARTIGDSNEDQVAQMSKGIPENTDDQQINIEPQEPKETPENIVGAAVKLIPSSNPENVLGNIQADVEKSASKLVEDATNSAKQTNDKINDMLQQIFPESMRNLDEITLRNNQKYLTNLTPEEQSIITQKTHDPMTGLAPPSKDIYKKHPRLETVYSKGSFLTTKAPPNRPPYVSKHRNADALVAQPEFVQIERKNEEATPFIDRNLLNMNSVINNVKNIPNTVFDNVKKGINLINPNEKVKAESPRNDKDDNSENAEGVGCKKEKEIEYLNVEPASSYDNLYRSSGVHLPTLDELLHPGKKTQHRPLDISKGHHTHLTTYKAKDSSEEQDIVESRHRDRNSDNYRNLGKFIPRDHVITRRDIVEQIKHKNMFFVGDGIKLPLTLKEFTDGSLHLSIDVKTLCNCKHCNGKRHHNATELVGNTQNVDKEEVDIPLKVYSDNNIPANAVQIVSKTMDGDLNQSAMGKEVQKRSVWNNNIEKINEASIPPEKFFFLKDIFGFMKNLVSDNVDIK